MKVGRGKSGKSGSRETGRAWACGGGNRERGWQHNKELCGLIMRWERVTGSKLGRGTSGKKGEAIKRHGVGVWCW